MHVSDITAILRSVAIFAHTPDTVLAELASGMKERRFEPSDMIIQKGELGNCMYLIGSGLTKVHDGMHTLIELGPGNLIGELAVLDTEPRSASVTAIEPTVAFQLSQEDFYSIVGNRPEVLQGIIRVLIQRTRNQNDLIIAGLKQREQELSRLVDERTSELRNANEQLMTIYAEIKLRNDQLEQANTEIKHKQAELENAYEEINANLEKVNQQNLEITKQKNQLEEQTAQLASSLHTIQQQQDMLVQSERMAAIGMLAPIVAHEINSPLGVLNAAQQNITVLVPQAFRMLSVIADHINPDDKNDFMVVVERTLQETPTLTTREERKYIRDIEDQLSQVNVPDTEEIAEKLVKIGLTDNIDSLVLLLQHLPATVSNQLVEVLYNVGMVRKQLSTMRTAIERAQKIITTLNNYVYKRNENDDPVETDVSETINTVLTLYEYHITQGIEVVQEIEEDLPPIMGYPDQLSQVWTNLLMNAQHAAKNQTDRPGKISVRVKLDGDFIQAEITDNGYGIPQAIQEKIFQPLFTTKKKGEGTGQGLSISKGIIEKHNGTIAFSSEPGETIFTIRLPIKKEE